MKKKELKKNKTGVIILCIILIYGVVTAIFFYKMNKEKEPITIPKYLILNGEDYYEYSDDKIKTISFENTDYRNILLHKKIKNRRS